MSVMFYPEFKFHFNNWMKSYAIFLKNNNAREMDIYKHLEHMPRPETKQQAEYVLEHMTEFLNRCMKVNAEECESLNLPGIMNPEDIAGAAIGNLIGYAKKKCARSIALDTVVKARKILRDMINAMVFQDDTLVIIRDNDGKIHDKEYEYKKVIDRAHTCDILIKNSFDIIHHANKFREDTEEDLSSSDFYSWIAKNPKMCEIIMNQRQETEKLKEKIEKQNRK